MENQKLKIGGYLWALSGLFLATGFIFHPSLTAEGMMEPAWIPDHVIILGSLFSLAFALNLLTMGLKGGLDAMGWTGYVLLSLSIFLFIGLVYFELFLIPIIASDLPGLFDEGLRIGPLKTVLPVTALLFILGHLFFGISGIRKGVLPKMPFMALIVFSVPVALKPVLPDLVADIGALCYGTASLFFTYGLLNKIGNG